MSNEQRVTSKKAALKTAVSSCETKLSNSGSPMSGSSGATSSKSACTRSSKKTKLQNSGMEDDDKFMAFLEQSHDSDREIMERMLDFTAQAENEVMICLGNW